jgi:hypothetical protein
VFWGLEGVEFRKLHISVIEITYFKCFGVLESAEVRKLHISVIEITYLSILRF